MARRFGRRLGAQLRAHLGRPESAQHHVDAIADALERYGYEPRCDERSVRLANCPFDSLAQGHRELVCGMNLDLVEGVIEGVGAEDLEACRQSREGECCVSLNKRPPT